jgi:hypothetical protein
MELPFFSQRGRQLMDRTPSTAVSLAKVSFMPANAPLTVTLPVPILFHHVDPLRRAVADDIALGDLVKCPYRQRHVNEDEGEAKNPSEKNSGITHLSVLA